MSIVNIIGIPINMNCFRDVTSLNYHVPMTTVTNTADTVLDGHWENVGLFKQQRHAVLYLQRATIVIML